jgi:YjbE family integral membrane protein
MESWLTPQTLTAVWQIIVVDILLSGDNAVVIALACRNLPAKYKRTAVLGGTAGAVILRLIFCFLVSSVLRVPALKLSGGLLLLWIGVKLMLPEHGDEDGEVQGTASFWGAIRTIILADIVMSFDNVVAIVAAAEGSISLIAFGLALSIPIIVFGSQLVLKVLTRFPLLVAAGAGLLGWLGGDIVTHDVLIEPHLTSFQPWASRAAAALGATLVIVVGVALKRRAAATLRPIEDLRMEGTK